MITTDKKDCVEHFLSMATNQQLLEELGKRYVAFVFIYEEKIKGKDMTSLGWGWAKSFSSLMGLLDYGQMRIQRIADEHISKQVNFDN